MYSDIKGIQILVSLLKQYNIRHLVISPGTRNTALAHSVETDDFFTCYSIVDERSAGYFALGLSEALNMPVCVSCTAATATTNYMPAIKEAYERNLQIVALTADQDLYGMFNMEDQTINQVDMFHGFVRYAVDVPMINNKRDEWYFTRCLNEAFLELDHNGKGPIQINYRMAYSLEQISSFNTKILPVARKIDRYENVEDWSAFSKIVKNKKKILIIGGSYFAENDILRKNLEKFFELFNCAIVTDTYANQREGIFLNPLAMGEVALNEKIESYAPDLIITFGSVFYATIKNFIPSLSVNAEHWQIAVDGVINDGYRCLTKVFECTPERFFEGVCKDVVDSKNDLEYYEVWRKRLEKFVYPDLKFTNFKVIHEFTKKLPKNSILHTSVLDAIRLSNYTHMDESIKCFANIGADGIDGALSTFLGQAASEEKLSFLLIGDLSLMYDMNALFERITPNVRILVINNYAGAEFHKNFGVERIPTLNLHIAAGHCTKIQQCAQLADVDYLQADDEESLLKALELFLLDNGKPILLEVFTDAKTDAETLKSYWKINKSTTTKGKIKETLKSIIGEKNIKKIKHMLRK